MGKLDLEYGICTNYKDFVLITKSRGYSKYFFFDFTKAKNEDSLKEFIGIFSKSRIVDEGFVEKLYDESIMEEKEFTKEFYNLYHETRLMLVKAFSEKQNVSKEDAIHYSQLFLNRLIFMFFVSDSGDIPNRLFTQQMHKVLNSDLVNEHSRLAFDQIVNLFRMMNKGSHEPKIFGFNGGLFADELPPEVYFKDIHNPKLFSDIQKHSKLKKSVNLDEYSQKIIKKYGSKLNPLISNLLIMDSFDFTTDVNVNILGHIFEQSISDLEELSGNETSKRKKEGVYYTPEYITDYICRNTIIPYLSKSGKVTDTQELISEYGDDIELLGKKFKEIKILDPACGSGAFLVKAVDVLLEINKTIQDYKQSLGKYSTGDQFSMDKWNEESEVRAIIENNIYGVDINEESVGITRLAMFLKLASNNRKLMNLSKNIMVGNSLIEDKSIDKRAFRWEDEFPDVIHKQFSGFDGFDIVLGNPPYFNIETLGVNSLYANGVKNAFPEIWMDKSDILFYFIAKSIQISKKQIGLIVSNAFLFSEKAEKLRNYILDNAPITKIVNFERYHVFEDAGITTSIIFLNKDHTKTTKALVLPRTDYEEHYLEEILKQDKLFFDVNLTKDSVFALVSKQIASINSKIDALGTPIGELFKVGSGMQTGLNSVFILTEFPKNFPQNTIKKRISGDIIQQYHIEDTEEFCLYIEDFENFEDIPIKVREYLQLHKQKLSNRADKKRRKSANWWDFTFAMHKELYNLDKIWCSYRGKNNCFVYDDTQEYIGLTNTTAIFGTNKTISLKYVLALLNSTLLNFRYRSIGKQTGGGIFEYFENGVSKIPIPQISSDEQEVFISKSSKLMNLYKEFHDKHKKFINRLVENFKIKITTSLQKFNELDSKDFFKEISKQTMNLSYTQQDDLEDYFKDRKRSLFKIQGKIELLETELDILVFKLFKITKEDQYIIYKSLS